MLIVMKIFKNLLFSLILIAGTSVAASAQRNDNRPPPKDPPPIVKPGDKKPQRPPDDKGDKPKKPSYEALAVTRPTDIDLA